MNIEEIRYIQHAYALSTKYSAQAGKTTCAELLSDFGKPRKVIISRDFSRSVEEEHYHAALAWVQRYLANYEHAQIVARADTAQGMIFFYRH